MSPEIVIHHTRDLIDQRRTRIWSDSTTRERQEQQHDIFSKTHILRFTDYVHGEVQGDRHSERKAMHRWVGAGLCSILPLHLPRRKSQANLLSIT